MKNNFLLYAALSITIIIFGIWYCKNFDNLNPKTEEKTLQTEAVSEAVEDNGKNFDNSIDKSENLEQNSDISTININTASSEQLKALPGVGDVLAERIIQYRSENPFLSVDEIKNVDGIGDKLYKKIKKYLTI